MMLRSVIVFSFALLILGCSGGNESAVGGVSQSEADALNNAAALLDQPSVAGSIATVNKNPKK